jgi:FtsP/CotA-like multicopper oxidase with cupredoxin domain
MHTISTHEHNGHNPAESDGFAGAFFFPGQYYDYRWPMVIAGHDTINVNATDPRAGTPTDDGGIVNIPGDYREIMSTHWFHDHMLDFTAQNVYKGNAAMMNYYSSIDRGNEAINDGVNLRLPSGSSKGWGNRDYDVNLVIAGKAWDDQGQLWYNPFQTDGMLGDRMLTNWQYHPYLDVRARKYRFRLLNGSVARYIKLALVVEREGNVGQFNGPAGSGVSYDTVPFHMIANDGNLMEHAINFDGTSGTRRGELPTQAIGERYDIVVDFSQFERGTNLYFVNLMAHDNGRGPDDRIPLGQVLNGTYNPTEVDLDGDGRSDTYVGGDRCVERFLQLRVKPMYPWMQDLSTDLAAYEPGGLKLVEHNRPTAFELANAHQRHFKFGRSGGTDKAPWTVENSEGAFTADTRRVTSAPAIGDIEVWTIEGTNGWSHPVHIHFEEAFVLSKDGNPPPIWERFARKDMYRVGPEVDSSSEIEIALRFREFAGTYVEHCHNTTHEDTAMLMRWDIEYPGQIKLMPSPLPSWDGVTYVTSNAFQSTRAAGPPPGATPVIVKD